MADYGEDLSCVDDIAEDGRTVSGPLAVGQAVARRLMTERGRLIRDPNYGYDLTAWINADISVRDLGEIRAGIVAEANKEERVNGATANIDVHEEGAATVSMTVTIDLELGEGPFQLILGVDAVSVSILSFEES